MRESGTAPTLIEEAAEIEFRNGMFYISDDAGLRAVRPNTFFKGFHRAAQAIQKYHAANTAEIVQFPELRAHH